MRRDRPLVRYWALIVPLRAAFFDAGVEANVRIFGNGINLSAAIEARLLMTKALEGGATMPRVYLALERRTSRVAGLVAQQVVPPDRYEIYNVGVVKDFRGFGLGRALVRYALGCIQRERMQACRALLGRDFDRCGKAALQQGVVGLVSGVGAEFYRPLGFETVQQRRAGLLVMQRPVFRGLPPVAGGAAAFPG